MRINPISINFYGYSQKYKIGNNSLEDIFDDNDVLIKRYELDDKNRLVETVLFDELGNVEEFLHKDYFEKENEKGFIETYVGPHQEYIRKSYEKTENGFRHVIDDFKSKTGKSYINDFVHDMSGKLVKIISNGKITMVK